MFFLFFVLLEKKKNTTFNPNIGKTLNNAFAANLKQGQNVNKNKHATDRMNLIK